VKALCRALLRLAKGPPIAIESSALGLVTSLVICETTPKTKRVISLTGILLRIARMLWVGSWTTMDAKNSKLVNMPQTTLCSIGE
jgi:hypothetical protein